MLEYSPQHSSTLSIPSGIIPLPSSQHNVVSANQQPYSVSQLAALANLSAQTLIAPPVASSTVVLPSPLSTSLSTLPDTPPPPYSTSDIVDEFSCSSPSQFLHSPKTVQSGTPCDERLTVSPEKSKDSHYSNSLRTRLLNLRKSKILEVKNYHENLLQERFFLEGGGNMMDYHIWKRKPNILKDQYLKQHDLDSDIVVFEDLLSPRVPSNLRDKIDTEDLLEQGPPLDIDSTMKFQSIPTTAFTTTPTSSVLFQSNTPVASSASVTSPSQCLTLTSPRPPIRIHSTLTSVTDISHEDIVMRARHEADVMKAISELRKEGLWSSTRLPKVQEPSRIKTHWDYLLEEMHWLATDFANERRWKLNAAKKVHLCNLYS